MTGLIKEIKYFDKIITLSQFEDEIIDDKKQDEIGSVMGKVGLSKAYKKYKNFMFLKLHCKINETSGKLIQQLIMVDPENYDEIFIAQKSVFLATNQNTVNSLLNAWIDYIKQNSNN